MVSCLVWASSLGFLRQRLFQAIDKRSFQSHFLRWIRVKTVELNRLLSMKDSTTSSISGFDLGAEKSRLRCVARPYLLA